MTPARHPWPRSRDLLADNPALGPGALSGTAPAASLGLLDVVAFVIPFLFRALSQELGRHFPLGALGELLVEALAFLQSALHRLCGRLFAQCLRERSGGTPGSDAVVFGLLNRTDQHEIQGWSWCDLLRVLACIGDKPL